MLDSLWFEKYRPKTLDDMVIEEHLKGKMLEFKETGEIPHILFVGTAGIGKTSLAKIIVEDILDCEALTINASDEGGIDTIRSKVTDFATSASLDGALKVIIFGEADGMTTAAQNSLKELIEECSESTRFIFTANDISKLGKPIVSRCQRYDLKFSEVEYIKACAGILQKEEVDFSENAKPLQQLLRSCYPDFRLAINEMQKSVVDGKFIPQVVEIDSFIKDVWKLVNKGNPEEVRAFCIENPSNYSSHADLMVGMVKFACNNFKVETTRKLVLVLNEFLVKDSSHVNKEINFYCCIITLCKHFNS